MSLYKRNSIWHYDVTLDGKRIRGSTKQRDEYLASLFLNDKMAEARKRGVDAILRKPPVLKDFAVEFRQWIENTQSIEPGTRKFYNHGLGMILKTPLVNLRMDRISNHECETIIFTGGSYHANCALRTLRRMFGKAHELKRIPEVPKISTRKEWPRSIAMSQADASAIAAHMTGNARDIFQLLRATGMRPKECFHMRWEYVRFDQGYYQNPKGKRPSARRAIPLLFDSLPILQRRHTEQGLPAEGWIFPGDSAGGHMITIQKAFTAARKAAGRPSGMCLYTARHGMMTDLAAVLPLSEVMKIGGHSDSKTAMGYQHSHTSDLQAKLDGAVTGRVQ